MARLLADPPATAPSASAAKPASASAPAGTQPATVKIVLKPIDDKPREAVKFTIEGQALKGGATFVIGPVTRNGQPIFALPNMKLDGNTGAFTWAPVPSQAGTYDVTFLVRQEPPRTARQEVRRIVAEPGPSPPTAGRSASCSRSGTPKARPPGTSGTSTTTATGATRT